MQVLVTGGAGFIGSHIVDLLVQEKHQVAVVDNLVTGKRENLNSEATFYEMGICSRDLEEVFAKEKPEAVIHLAAQATVPRAVENPLYDAEINISGTINLLEMMRRFSVRKIVYSSSAAIYGNPVELPVKEDHPLVPVSPYGLSKYVAEEYINLYRRMYGIEFSILRYANVYGPRQTLEGEAGVVTIFVNKIKEGASLVINGDGRHTRDFVYVLDVAAANLKALETGQETVVNISTGKEISLKTLTEILAQASGKSVEVVYGPERPGDIVYSSLDAAKAQQCLGWTATTSLEEGMKQLFS